MDHTIHADPLPDPKAIAAEWGLSVPMYAFALALISGASLPLGAYMGIIMGNVKESKIAAMMAFGAGALLFAVTVELYAHALHQVHAGHMKTYEINVTMTCAIGGGLFYLSVNRWLENFLMGGHSDDEEEVLIAATVTHRDDKIKTAELERAAIKEHKVEHGKKTGRGVIGKLQDMEHVNQKHCEFKAMRGWKKIRTMVRKAAIIAAMDTAARNRGLAEELKRGKNHEDIKKMKGETFKRYLTKAMEQVEYDHRIQDKVADAECEDENLKEVAKAKLVAIGLFMGLLIDGIPEGVLMGFLAAEGNLKPVLVISLFVANFPEAFASASLLRMADISYATIIGMWVFLNVLVALLCGFSCWALTYTYPAFADGHEALPEHVLVIVAAVEGVTGGAMIACLASVMLPEAFEKSNKEGSLVMSSGFMCLAGFLLSVLLKAYEP